MVYVIKIVFHLENIKTIYSLEPVFINKINKNKCSDII